MLQIIRGASDYKSCFRLEELPENIRVASDVKPLTYKRCLIMLRSNKNGVAGQGSHKVIKNEWFVCVENQKLTACTIDYSRSSGVDGHSSPQNKNAWLSNKHTKPHCGWTRQYQNVE